MDNKTRFVADLFGIGGTKDIEDNSSLNTNDLSIPSDTEEILPVIKPKPGSWDLLPPREHPVVKKWIPKIEDAVSRYPNIDSDLPIAVMHQESRGNPKALSSAGAYGLMQLMPKTAENLGVDRRNSTSNIEGGVMLLSDLSRKYLGDKKKILAAYNWGEGNLNRAIKKYKTDWLSHAPKETKNYVSLITQRLENKNPYPVSDNVDGEVSAPSVLKTNDITDPDEFVANLFNLDIKKDTVYTPVNYENMPKDAPYIPEHMRPSSEKDAFVKELFTPKEGDIAVDLNRKWNPADVQIAQPNPSVHEPWRNIIESGVETSHIGSQIGSNKPADITATPLPQDVPTAFTEPARALDRTLNPRGIYEPSLAENIQEDVGKGGRKIPIKDSPEQVLAGEIINMLNPLGGGPDALTVERMRDFPKTAIAGNIIGTLPSLLGGQLALSKGLLAIPKFMALAKSGKALASGKKTGEIALEAITQMGAGGLDYTLRNREALMSGDPEVRQKAMTGLAANIAAMGVSAVPGGVLPKGWYQPVVGSIVDGVTNIGAMAAVGEDPFSKENIASTIANSLASGIFRLQDVKPFLDVNAKTTTPDVAIKSIYDKTVPYRAPGQIFESKGVPDQTINKTSNELTFGATQPEDVTKRFDAIKARIQAAQTKEEADAAINDYTILTNEYPIFKPEQRSKNVPEKMQGRQEGEVIKGEPSKAPVLTPEQQAEIIRKQDNGEILSKQESDYVEALSKKPEEVNVDEGDAQDNAIWDELSYTEKADLVDPTTSDPDIAMFSKPMQEEIMKQRKENAESLDIYLKEDPEARGYLGLGGDVGKIPQMSKKAEKLIKSLKRDRLGLGNDKDVGASYTNRFGQKIAGGIGKKRLLEIEKFADELNMEGPLREQYYDAGLVPDLFAPYDFNYAEKAKKHHVTSDEIITWLNNIVPDEARVAANVRRKQSEGFFPVGRKTENEPAIGMSIKDVSKPDRIRITPEIVVRSMGVKDIENYRASRRPSKSKQPDKFIPVSRREESQPGVGMTIGDASKAQKPNAPYKPFFKSKKIEPGVVDRSTERVFRKLARKWLFSGSSFSKSKSLLDAELELRGAKSETEGVVSDLRTDLNRAEKEVYGKITDEQRFEIDQVLKGKGTFEQKIKNIESDYKSGKIDKTEYDRLKVGVKKLNDVVQNIIDYKNSRSEIMKDILVDQRMQKDKELQADLKSGKIDKAEYDRQSDIVKKQFENFDVKEWINRSYRIFDDSKHAEKVLPEVRQRAKDFLREQDVTTKRENIDNLTLRIDELKGEKTYLRKKLTEKNLPQDKYIAIKDNITSIKQEIGLLQKDLNTIKQKNKDRFQSIPETVDNLLGEKTKLKQKLKTPISQEDYVAGIDKIETLDAEIASLKKELDATVGKTNENIEAISKQAYSTKNAILEAQKLISNKKKLTDKENSLLDNLLGQRDVISKRLEKGYGFETEKLLKSRDSIDRKIGKIFSEEKPMELIRKFKKLERAMSVQQKIKKIEVQKEAVKKKLDEPLTPTEINDIEQKILDIDKKITEKEALISEGEKSTLEEKRLAEEINSLDAEQQKLQKQIDEPITPSEENIIKNKIKDIDERINEALKAVDENKTNLSDAQLNEKIEILLGINKGEAKDVISTMQNMRSITQDILKERKDIPEAIRALWGEYQRADVNATRSIVKINNYIANYEFQSKVRDAGLKEGLFYTEPRVIDGEAFNTQIASEGSKTWEPLAGLYTTKELADQLKSADTRIQQKWLRLFMQGVAATKYSKTVLSPGAQAVNFISNVFIAAANGNINLKTLGKSWKLSIGELTKKNASEQRAFINWAKKEGLIGESVNSGEIREVVRDATQEDIDVLLSSGVTGAVRKTSKVLERLYAFGDDFWKLNAYFDIKQKYEKTGVPISDKEIIQIVRDTYPTYSNIPKIVEGLRKYPFMGTFVSWQAEMMRTTYGTMKQMAKEYVNPKTRGLARQRIAGIIGTIAFFSMTRALTQKNLGENDKDKRDALNEFTPKYQQNSQFAIKGIDEKTGKITYVDMTRTNPYAFITKPLIALLDGKDWEEDFWKQFGEVISEPFSSFVSEDILTSKILDITRNSKKGSGAKVYNEYDQLDKWTKIPLHILSAVEPGAISLLRRMGMATEGKTDASGNPYTVGNELSSLFGVRTSTVDVLKNIEFAGHKYSKERAGIIAYTKQNKQEPNLDNLQKELYRKVNAARTFGYSESDIAKALEGSVSKDEIAFISIAADKAIKSAIENKAAVPEVATKLYNDLRKIGYKTKLETVNKRIRKVAISTINKDDLKALGLAKTEAEKSAILERIIPSGNNRQKEKILKDANEYWKLIKGEED